MTWSDERESSEPNSSTVQLVDRKSADSPNQKLVVNIFWMCNSKTLHSTARPLEAKHGFFEPGRVEKHLEVSGDQPLVELHPDDAAAGVAMNLVSKFYKSKLVFVIC